MNQSTNIQRTLQKGDRIAYTIDRTISTGHHSTRATQVRRTGIVQGWRDGKVVVLHKAGYTEDLAEANLTLVE